MRDALGPDGRVRIDANGALGRRRRGRRDRACSTGRPAGWSTSSSRAPRVEDLAVVRRRVDVPIAADESIRRAADPYRVRDLEAADIAVLKVQPLGGVRACLRIAEDIGLPVVVSSALETSVGIAAGVALAAALPELPYACGLATVQLLDRRRRSPSRCSRSTARCRCGVPTVDESRSLRRRRPTGSRTGRPGWPRSSGAAGSSLVSATRLGPRRRHRAWSRPASREVVLAPGSRNAPLSLRGVRRRRRRAGPPAHPDRRAHRRVPRARPRPRIAPPRRGRSARPAPASPTCTRRCSRPPTPASPLVVVTADRPARLRGTGANQTTDQVGSSAPLVRDLSDAAGVDLATPLVRRPGPPQRASSTSRWCPRTAGRPDVDARGPSVQRQRTPDDATSRSRPGRARSWSPVTTPARRRGCSPSTRGWPLLAEPSSGSRTGANAIRTYRLLLGSRARSQRIERVVVLRPPDAVPAGDPAAVARTDVEVARHPGARACGPSGRSRSTSGSPSYRRRAARRPGLARGVARGRRARSSRSSTRCSPPSPTSRRTRSPARSRARCPPAACSSSARPARSATST